MDSLVDIQLLGAGSVHTIGTHADRRSEPIPFKAGVGRSGEYEVFGLYLNDLPTQMCYRIEDLLENGRNVIAEARSSKQAHFYFDAGGNGQPIYCAIDELERVMSDLGLIPDAAGRMTFSCFMRDLTRVITKYEEYHAHAVSAGDEYGDDRSALGDWYEDFVTFLSMQEDD